jgi:hypothetical protein
MFTKVDNSTDFNLAWKILSTHHGEVDDFFKFWPPDKNYFLQVIKMHLLLMA